MGLLLWQDGNGGGGMDEHWEHWCWEIDTDGGIDAETCLKSKVNYEKLYKS